jgi:hypothetical protein
LLEALAEDCGEVHVAEGAEAVVQGDDDAVAAPGEILPAIDRRRARADQESATVNPDQDRSAFAIECRCPHVQIEALVPESAGREIDPVEDRQ